MGLRDHRSRAILLSAKTSLMGLASSVPRKANGRAGRKHRWGISESGGGFGPDGLGLAVVDETALSESGRARPRPILRGARLAWRLALPESCKSILGPDHRGLLRPAGKKAQRDRFTKTFVDITRTFV
jgi:hypothetical protein